MHKLIGTALMAVTLSATGAAMAQQTSETRAIDARVLKVKLGRMIDLRVKQGPTPSLVITGDQRYVPKVVTTQQGDTIHIDIGRTRHVHFGSNHKEQLRAEMTLPNFNELMSQGVGSAEISGFSGEQIRLALDGAGSVTLASRYRNIDASLGGVGSMTLKSANADKVDLKLRGAGHMEIKGNSKLLLADLGGVGSLDAEKLVSDAVELDMSGLGGATVHAKSSVKVKLSGMGSATVYGNPATRVANAKGMGSITWE